MTIADHEDVPMRTRNTWMLAAGYAPRYSEQSLDSARMVPIKAAIQRLLDTHYLIPVWHWTGSEMWCCTTRQRPDC